MKFLFPAALSAACLDLTVHRDYDGWRYSNFFVEARYPNSNYYSCAGDKKCCTNHGCIEFIRDAGSSLEFSLTAFPLSKTVYLDKSYAETTKRNRQTSRSSSSGKACIGEELSSFLERLSDLSLFRK